MLRLLSCGAKDLLILMYVEDDEIETIGDLKIWCKLRLIPLETWQKLLVARLQ